MTLLAWWRTESGEPSLHRNLFDAFISRRRLLILAWCCLSALLMMPWSSARLLTPSLSRLEGKLIAACGSKISSRVIIRHRSSSFKLSLAVDNFLLLCGRLGAREPSVSSVASTRWMGSWGSRHAWRFAYSPGAKLDRAGWNENKHYVMDLEKQMNTIAQIQPVAWLPASMQTLVRTCVQADPVELDNGDVSAPSRFTGKTQVVEWDFATEEAGKTGQVSVLMLLDNYLLNNPLCLLILDTFSSYSSFFVYMTKFRPIYCSRCNSRTCQYLITWSVYPANNREPSADHANDTQWGDLGFEVDEITSGLSSSTWCLFSRSQILITGPVATQSQYLFGEKHRAVIISLWSNVYKCLLSARSHNITLKSLPPEAHSEPSGETVTVFR